MYKIIVSDGEVAVAVAGSGCGDRAPWVFRCRFDLRLDEAGLRDEAGRASYREGARWMALASACACGEAVDLDVKREVLGPRKHSVQREGEVVPRQEGKASVDNAPSAHLVEKVTCPDWEA